MINENQIEQIRTIIRGIRHKNESNEELMKRVMEDSRVLTTILSILPQCQNIGLVKHLLNNQDFITTL